MTVACGPELLGQRGEAANVGEQHRGLDALAAEDLLVPSDQLVGERRIHVAGHGGAHALLATDVFHHDHRAEMPTIGADEREHGDVHGHPVTVVAGAGVHEP